MPGHITIDGSHGEGGGQMLRSALALSILTRRPFKMINIRAGRAKPGLRPQHLASVKAAAKICGADYKGAKVDSSTLNFEPGDVQVGDYKFDIGTAGATSLVLHTVYLPLALRGDKPSVVTITGGTHVSNSPCFDYLKNTWTAWLAKMDLNVELELVKTGFYPRGGGEIRATIHPAPTLRPIHAMKKVELTTISGVSAVAGLGADIGKRQARRLGERFKREDVESHIEQEEWPGGPGTVVTATFRQLPVPACFFAIGERGKPAESVADDCAEEALRFRESKAPVDPHAADQLLLPLAFAEGASEYRPSEVTLHLKTNIEVIQQFLDRAIKISTEGVVYIEANSV